MSELGFTYFLRSNIHKMSSSLIWASVSVVKLQLIVDLIRCSIPKAFTEQARKNPVNTMFLINSSPSSLKNVQNDTSENNIPNRHAFTQQYFHRPALKMSRVDEFFKINSIQELSQFSPVSLKLSNEEFVTTLQAVHNPVF